MQSAGAEAPWLRSQLDQCIHRPSYRPRPPPKQAEHEELARQCHDLEARELEVKRRTRALNLDAVRDVKVKAAAPVTGSSHSSTRERIPLKPKCASSQVTSQRSLATQGPPAGIKVNSTVTTKTVKSFPASPQDRNKSGYIGYGAGHD